MGENDIIIIEMNNINNYDCESHSIELCPAFTKVNGEDYKIVNSHINGFYEYLIEIEIFQHYLRKANVVPLARLVCKRWKEVLSLPHDYDAQTWLGTQGYNIIEGMVKYITPNRIALESGIKEINFQGICAITNVVFNNPNTKTSFAAEDLLTAATTKNLRMYDYILLSLLRSNTLPIIGSKIHSKTRERVKELENDCTWEILKNTIEYGTLGMLKSLNSKIYLTSDSNTQYIEESSLIHWALHSKEVPIFYYLLANGHRPKSIESLYHYDITIVKHILSDHNSVELCPAFAKANGGPHFVECDPGPTLVDPDRNPIGLRPVFAKVNADSEEILFSEYNHSSPLNNHQIFQITGRAVDGEKFIEKIRLGFIHKTKYISNLITAGKCDDFISLYKLRHPSGTTKLHLHQYLKKAFQTSKYGIIDFLLDEGATVTRMMWVGLIYYNEVNPVEILIKKGVRFDGRLSMTHFLRLGPSDEVLETVMRANHQDFISYPIMKPQQRIQRLFERRDKNGIYDDRLYLGYAKVMNSTRIKLMNKILNID